MNLGAFYEIEAGHHDIGHEIDGRVRKATGLFQRYLGTADRLLDIGCGAGGVGIYLKSVLKAKEVYGVEISEKRARMAQALGVQASRVDIAQEGLPFPSESFDAIFCGEIIEHLVDTDHLLDEIRRVLTSTGLCVLTTPNLGAWYNRIALFLGWQPFDTSVSLRHEVGRPKGLVSEWGCRGHLQIFTYRALRELLAAHGFETVKATGTAMSDVFAGLGNFRRHPRRALLYLAVRPIDSVLSKSPSLGGRIVVAFRRRE